METQKPKRSRRILTTEEKLAQSEQREQDNRNKTKLLRAKLNEEILQTLAKKFGVEKINKTFADTFDAGKYPAEKESEELQKLRKELENYKNELRTKSQELDYCKNELNRKSSESDWFNSVFTNLGLSKENIETRKRQIEIGEYSDLVHGKPVNPDKHLLFLYGQNNNTNRKKWYSQAMDAPETESMKKEIEQIKAKLLAEDELREIPF